MPSPSEHENFVNAYPLGTRVKAVHFDFQDPNTEIDDNITVPSGTEGTVVGHIFPNAVRVNWDNGSHIGFLPDLDQVEIV